MKEKSVVTGSRLCVAIVGSHRIDDRAFGCLSRLAETLCLENHVVISGGEKQGADLAAEVGAARVRGGENLVLYLSPQFQRFHQYPAQAQLYFVPVGPGAHLTPSWQLAWEEALPEQRGRYWERFWRNAYIAMAADIIFEWRVDDQSHSTEHLLRCARKRNKLVVNSREISATQPWTSEEEFVEVAQMVLDQLLGPNR
jgi:hypothetical protein